MSLDSLASQFHAVDFLPTLEAFIKHFIPHTKAKLTSHSRFDAFKRVTFKLSSLQQFEEIKHKDVIRATPYVPPQEQKAAVPEHFDTVLVHYTTDAEETSVEGVLQS